MATAAVPGALPFPVLPARPSWDDMRSHYPGASVPTATLYDQKIRGPFIKLYEHPAYQNTCAVRMSYALNRSGAPLARSASSGGSVRGGDKYWYWIRVAELKAELTRRFQGADEELTLTPVPAKAFGNNEEMARLFDVRVQQGKRFIETRLAGRCGIVAFDVAGWGDASGHFTLWDGEAGQLAYANGHDEPDSASYYFWLTQLSRTPERTKVIQVTRIKFWELK